MLLSSENIRNFEIFLSKPEDGSNVVLDGRKNFCYIWRIKSYFSSIYVIFKSFQGDIIFKNSKEVVSWMVQLVDQRYTAVWSAASMNLRPLWVSWVAQKSEILKMSWEKSGICYFFNFHQSFFFQNYNLEFPQLFGMNTLWVVSQNWLLKIWNVCFWKNSTNRLKKAKNVLKFRKTWNFV